MSSRFSVSTWTPEGSEANQDMKRMQIALDCAREARLHKEVPVGAALYLDGELLGQGFNQPCSSKDPTSHAEVVAIRQACQSFGNYRLTHSTLYVTLQPCLMCLGAIMHARIGRVVIGAPDSRYNSELTQTLEAFRMSEAWHDCSFETGCMAEQSQSLMKEFFQARRPDRYSTLKNLKSLSDLPNVNKTTVALLNTLGFQTGEDFCNLGLSESQLKIMQTIQAQSHRPIEPDQIAILKSLCDFLQGEPVRSWKDYQ
jgi:tRNA(adenine34) deaminase